MEEDVCSIALKHCLKGDFEESEKILRSHPDCDTHPAIQFNLGWHEIKKGNLCRGMSMLDFGRYINCYGLPRISGEIWKDQDLKDKVVLFRCEGGFGDQIINIRFVKDFEEMGAKVIVACATELHSLFSHNGLICVDNNYTDRVYYDYWIPAMSAAHILKYENENLSGKAYLFSNSKRHLYSKKGTLKVGIRWAGRPEFEHQQYRIFDPQPLIDLHEIKGTTLYSLQRDDNVIDGLPFSDLKHDMKTFKDTCEIIADLDLIITSCTSIAHLAAAMGKETWVIVPCLPYYIWAKPGDTTPWYDSVKIFRQEVFGNWDVPLNNVKNCLQEKVNALLI